MACRLLGYDPDPDTASCDRSRASRHQRRVCSSHFWVHTYDTEVASISSRTSNTEIVGERQKKTSSSIRPDTCVQQKHNNRLNSIVLYALIILLQNSRVSEILAIMYNICLYKYITFIPKYRWLSRGERGNSCDVRV